MSKGLLNNFYSEPSRQPVMLFAPVSIQSGTLAAHQLRADNAAMRQHHHTELLLSSAAC